MKFLGNIKVATKVFAGSGLILVMLLVSSAVTVLGLLSVQTNFSDYRGLARATNAVSSVESELLYARLGVKDFILKGTKEAAAAVRERASAAKSALGTAVTLSSDPEAKTVIQKAEGQVAQYEGAFGEIVQLRAEQDTLVAKLNDAGPQTEESLTAIMQIANRDADAVTTYKTGQALRYLLLARLYANRFLVENEQEQIDRVNSEMASLEKIAREIGSGNLVAEQRSQFDRLNAQVKIYRDTFAAIGQLVAKRNGIVSAQLDKIGPMVAKSLEDVKAENRKLQDELGPRATAEIEQSITVGAAASALALVLGIASAFIIGRGISRPVVAMTDAMRKLAEGDKTIEIPARENKDEIGQMAIAVQVFKENMIRAEQLAAEQEQERKARELRGQKIEQLTKDFDQTVSGVLDLLAAATTELQSTAESMSATAEETSRQSTAVAAASEQATNNVQTVSTAAEELSSSISEISRQVSQSNEIAGKAATEAAKTNVHVEGLATSAQKIGEVVALISEIADKTNLLALNATIEAARAGDAGKGFAVVASEVKTLATQTAKATEEISEQVGGIQSATGEAVTAIKGIAKIIEEMNEVATVIASAVEEQGAATSEISRNVQQAAAGTQEVSTNISGVSTAAGETGTAATQVQASAGQLAKQSDALKSSVEHFLREVRAA